MEGEKAALKETLDDQIQRNKQNGNADKGQDSFTLIKPKTLDDMISALGELPPSYEEIIAKLKNQVNYLMKVRDIFLRIFVFKNLINVKKYLSIK